MKLKLSERQADEYLSRCQSRRETVESDPESGDEFENTPGALEALEAKIKSDTIEVTTAEYAWMKGEAENMQDIADSNSAHPEWDGERISVRNLVKKF